MSIDIDVAIKSKKPYVYTLAYPDGKVFYVGKGIHYRINGHHAEAMGTRKECNPYKCRVIRKIWASGDQVLKTVLACFETDEQAHMYEIALIFLMDELTNLTAGGEGVRGLVRSDAYRKRMSTAHKGPHTEAHRLKISEANKGKKHTRKQNEDANTREVIV